MSHFEGGTSRNTAYRRPKYDGPGSSRHRGSYPEREPSEFALFIWLLR